MVPAQLQVIDALPLTANGKLDQRRLQSWVRGAGAPVAARGAAPETELESAIAAVWTDLFGAEGVPRDGGFFELGGDSLLAAQIAGRLREVVDEAAAVFFDDLLRMLLQGPTVASLARELAQARPDGEHRAEETGASPLVELSADGDRPPRVLIGGEDSLAELAPVIARLAEAGGVLGLRTVAPSEPEALEVTAGRYAQLLLDQGRLTLHLVGLPEAEAVALEVARHLLEAGTEVLSLTVAGAPAETPPSPYLGDVTLLVPEAEAESARAAAQARWQECCLGEVELVTVPGDRRTAFDGANAAAMAAALARP
jgi:pyochelin synthetase